MTSILATRAARRRGIVFIALLLTTVLLMAFSSNPTVRDVQSGIGFAFRPIQGALDQVGAAAASVASTIAEIDRLRTDNSSLRAENERLAAENVRLGEIRRENDSLTALLQLRAGLDYDTVAMAATYEAAVRAAGGAVALVDELMSGSAATGFSAMRPPGHHAEPARAMGFCFFGNVAVAARRATSAHGVSRVITPAGVGLPGLR